MRPLTLLPAVAVLALPLLAQRGQMAGPPSPLGAEQIESTGATKSNVVYGVAGKTKLKLDVYLPKPRPRPESPVPAVVMIHGGAWMYGDKEELAPMGRWLARNGYAAFSIDYRLLDGSKNQWPAQMEDAQAAVRWVRAHAADYGADPARIGAFGYSAGAQMAALLGVHSKAGAAAAAQAPDSVQAVAEQAGPADFTSPVYNNVDSIQFFPRLFGAGPAQYPARWRAASPALNVTDNTPPFLIFHGTRDGDVPIALSMEFREVLKAHGIPVTFVTVDETHELQSSESKKKLAAEVLKFFDATLKGPPAPASSPAQP